jgi:alkylated DNA repair dioxygenase AlkB
VQNQSLGQGSWYRYEPAWLADPGTLLDRLQSVCAWEQPNLVAHRPDGSTTTVVQPRLLDWGGTLAYRYSGLTLPPKPIPEPLIGLTERLNAELDASFNHVVLNLYRDGRDHVGWHSDSEGQLGYEPLIAGLSLGAVRRFEVVPKWRGKRARMSLAPGSLLVMGGGVQHRFRHRVPRQAHVTEPRINVTWRTLLGPPGTTRASVRSGCSAAPRET